MRKLLRGILCLMFAAATGSAAAFPIDSDNIYEANAEVGVGDRDYWTTVTAYCRDGDFAVSGGCYNFGSGAKLMQSLKQGTNSWLCNFDNSVISYPEFPPIIPTVFVIRGSIPVRGAVVYCAHP